MGRGDQTIPTSQIGINYKINVAGPQEALELQEEHGLFHTVCYVENVMNRCMRPGST